MAAPILIILVLFTLVGAFGWWMHKWQYQRADALLSRWAQQNGYTVSKKERDNPIGTGPGVRYAANTQVIYRIEVEDSAGNRRFGRIKLGTVQAGTLSDEVEVEWQL